MTPPTNPYLGLGAVVCCSSIHDGCAKLNLIVSPIKHRIIELQASLAIHPFQNGSLVLSLYTSHPLPHD